MKLFVGLGNPGAKYAVHRHNIGFMAVDSIADDNGFSSEKARFQGLVREGSIQTSRGSEKVLILKPTTYMNESGRSVGEAARFFRIETDDIFVFHDELDLAPAKTRVKQGGGNAGHNGLKSISAHLGPDFWRVRLGIGHPGVKARVHGHVLGNFTKTEIDDWLGPLLDAVSRAAPLLAEDDTSGFASEVARRMGPIVQDTKPSKEG
jgi:PTH1 family peptidyl-tRNA hydrolase